MGRASAVGRGVRVQAVRVGRPNLHAMSLAKSAMPRGRGAAALAFDF